MGVTILFVIMENPEANLDRGLGCFNSYAMAEYITQLIEHKQDFSMLDISFERDGLFEESGMDKGEIMREIIRITHPYKDIFVFKKRYLGFILISRKKQWLEAAGKEISNYLQGLEFRHENVTLVLSNQADFMKNPDDLMRFLSFVGEEYADKHGKLLVVNDNIIEKYREQDVIKKEITAALEDNRVEVFLQPIFSNKKKYFTSAEALVRIRKKTGELLPPGLFIPIAEESGQILEIGERVLKVCDFLKNSNAVQLGLEYIEVNLSVIQCEQSELARRLIEIADSYGVEPKRINLEITETASISARTTLLNNMKTLMEYGFTFSLDDFGKGESNLMYVVEMPVSIVKLDYDMSKAFFTSPKAKHVVRAVVKMAHDMNLKLVAEGIETKEEIDSMYQENIDYIQGYYYSKPLPMQEALLFLSEYGKE